MAKNFRTDVEFNNNLTASAGNVYLSSTASAGGNQIATQSWVESQGYSTTGGSSSSITASAGTVGGWKISASSLYNQSNTAGTYAGIVSASSASYAFFSGANNADSESSQFFVTPAGVMRANSASIFGSVTFTNGTIGDWTVSSGGLAGGNITSGSANLTAASVSGLVVATRDWVQSQGYSTSAASIQYSTASLRNTSTTVYQNPTGMTGITLRAGVLYKYEIGILYRVITTNQVFKCRLNHPAFTVGTAHVVIGTNTTAISYTGLEKTLTGTQTTLDSTTTTNAGAGLLHQRVDGFILTSASGVLSYDFAPTSAATGADVFENSYMLVTPVTAV